MDPCSNGRPPPLTTAECLAPLCRRHRLKTFVGCTYHRAEDGTYLWCDRYGRRLPDERRTAALQPAIETYGTAIGHGEVRGVSIARAAAPHPPE